MDEGHAEGTGSGLKILWLKSDFLHPTTKGGQIRTLETLRRLHARHEVHYVAFHNPADGDGPARAHEYCSRAYPVEWKPTVKGSPLFFLEVAGNLVSAVPAVIARYHTPEMKRLVARLIREEAYDSFVCDFLAPAENVPDVGSCVLFQHNVETVIWQRYARQAPDRVRRAYFNLQARRMLEYERKVCREAGLVIAVSEADADTMRQMFGAKRVAHVPTGVDVDSLTPPNDSGGGPRSGLVFVGSMDWLPNVDGIEYFIHGVMPLIRRRRPDVSLTIVGRNPPKNILELAERYPNITVTGTVPDVRPYLWSGAVSIVPLRIGGGTRLKIYESMAARIPVVSTTIGAEGLDVDPPENIRIADTETAFAEECLQLLDDCRLAKRIAAAGWDMVSSRFSWEKVAVRFEEILRSGPVPCL